MIRVFEGGTERAGLDPRDRAHAYGDGLFETMRAHAGEVPWWDAHLARLARDAARLRIALPDAGHMHATVRGMLAAGSGEVVRLQVSRGAGPRGYAADPSAPAAWNVGVYRLGPTPGRLRLRWCETRLALQPALAGIKHCNRLEQVLARAEWPTAGGDVDEGLMQDTEGKAVCATAANLFVLRDGEWLTPPVDRCGVRGVCRDWLIGAADARELRLERTDVEHAEAVVLCNAVRGILEVARLGDHEWSPHPRVARLRERLAAAHPAFAIPSEFT